MTHRPGTNPSPPTTWTEIAAALALLLAVAGVGLWTGCGEDAVEAHPAADTRPELTLEPVDLGSEELGEEEPSAPEEASEVPDAGEAAALEPADEAASGVDQGGSAEGAGKKDRLTERRAELQSQGLSALIGTSGDGSSIAAMGAGDGLRVGGGRTMLRSARPGGDWNRGDLDTEAYEYTEDNSFLAVTDKPLSTFSIDVDTASYANVRRFLDGGSLPPTDAVRVEEMINYFSYDYAPPTGDTPFATHVEVAGCPWATDHRLVRVGLKGRQLPAEDRPATNLVFLLDVSGSMNDSRKLPLVKDALGMLANQLGVDDRVAIVVYAGASGLVLPSTSGGDRQAIRDAMRRLKAGGSTNGAAGIELAYETARANFIDGGVNRVVLATDGDFNIGVTDQGELVRLVQDQADSGVFLTVLGFGMGNYKDSTLEKLADEGNGNYAYIDGRAEARKVLVDQVQGTLVTIAKDVKIQVEFNPAQVAHYRLIGYENRLLEDRDFNDDSKDAGDIGAGHTVTALYEVVPPGVELAGPDVDPLKYQQVPELSESAAAGELLTLKLRYKQPDGDTSQLLTFPVRDAGRGYAQASADFKFAASVAAFGMLLRSSPHRGTATYDGVLELAGEGAVRDPHGYRAQFIELVRTSRDLAADS